jgi:Spy/CpxP family protein refolding chaperone
MSMLRSLCLLGFVSFAVLALVADVNAQENKGRRPGQGGPGGFGMRDQFQLPESLGVTDEQKTKLADLKKKYEDKLKAATEKAKLTDEQTAKQREAFGKLRGSGKSFAEMQEEVAKELNLTADQKKGREELTALRAEITKDIDGVLTEEQKKKLAELRTNRGQPGKRPDRKKDE